MLLKEDAETEAPREPRNIEATRRTLGVAADRDDPALPPGWASDFRTFRGRSLYDIWLEDARG